MVCLQEPPKAVELKINVRSPVSRPAIMLQMKTDENGVNNGDSGEGSAEEVSSGGKSSGEESPEADSDAARSPQFLLEKAPLATQRLTREVNINPDLRAHGQKMQCTDNVKCP